MNNMIANHIGNGPFCCFHILKSTTNFYSIMLAVNQFFGHVCFRIRHHRGILETSHAQPEVCNNWPGTSCHILSCLLCYPGNSLWQEGVESRERTLNVCAVTAGRGHIWPPVPLRCCRAQVYGPEELLFPFCCLFCRDCEGSGGAHPITKCTPETGAVPAEAITRPVPFHFIQSGSRPVAVLKRTCRSVKRVWEILTFCLEKLYPGFLSSLKRTDKTQPT